MYVLLSLSQELKSSFFGYHRLLSCTEEYEEKEKQKVYEHWGISLRNLDNSDQ